MRIVPEVGISKPATMRRVVVLPQPDGPRNETNSPRSTARSKLLHHGLVLEALAHVVDLEKCHSALLLAPAGRLGRFAAPKTLIRPMQAQVTRKAMIASADGS